MGGRGNESLSKCRAMNFASLFCNITRPGEGSGSNFLGRLEAHCTFPTSGLGIVIRRKERSGGKTEGRTFLLGHLASSFLVCFQAPLLVKGTRRIDIHPSLTDCDRNPRTKDSMAFSEASPEVLSAHCSAALKKHLLRNILQSNLKSSRCYS